MNRSYANKDVTLIIHEGEEPTEEMDAITDIVNLLWHPLHDMFQLLQSESEIQQEETSYSTEKNIENSKDSSSCHLGNG